MFEIQDFRNCIINCFESNKLPKLADEQIEKFHKLANYLVEVNKSMNLTAITDLQGICLKHFADSITALPYLPAAGNVIDIGCGGGFPAIPLAIMRPELHFTAVDSTAKKLDFVKSACKMCGIGNVTVLCGRAEDLSKDIKYRESFDVVLSRAVADMQILSELCIPFVKIGGCFVALKGKNGLEELERSHKAILILGCDEPSYTSFELMNCGIVDLRHIICSNKSRHTDVKYPRQYGQIKKKPL